MQHCTIWLQNISLYITEKNKAKLIFVVYYLHQSNANIPVLQQQNPERIRNHRIISSEVTRKGNVNIRNHNAWCHLKQRRGVSYLDLQLANDMSYQQKVLAFHPEQLQWPLDLEKNPIFLAQADKNINQQLGTADLWPLKL